MYYTFPWDVVLYNTDYHDNLLHVMIWFFFVTHFHDHAGEETKNPQKSIPIGIVVALLVISVSYCSIAAIVTLMCPYFLVDINAPLPFIFKRVGWDVAKYIITIGALCGLSTR